MKIGILGQGFIDWGGGVDFLRLVAGSLVAADPGVELHFLVPTAGPRFRTRELLRQARYRVYTALGRPCAKPARPDFRHVTELVESIGGGARLHQIDTGMAALRRASLALELDVMLPAIAPLHGQVVPWIGYLFDYQHAYYPHFFTAAEVARRERAFQAMLAAASHVIVNARAVASDIEKFHPGHQAQIVAMPFSAAPTPQWLAVQPEAAARYGIAGPYFIISNQFWQHKDHLTAWKALARLLQDQPQAQLVCTGEPHDYRNPAHFENLTRAADELGISARLKVLGLIPKADQISLLRGAVAVIQPSLFEGGPGGGAVFDAVSLGVPAIVSDVPVNLELEEAGIVFFKAGDPEALAARMGEALAGHAARVPGAAQDLLASGAARRRRCGEVLLAAIHAVRASHAGAHAGSSYSRK